MFLRIIRNLPMTHFFTISVLLFCSINYSEAQPLWQPDTVTVESDHLQLKGLLWRPAGKGAFPAVIFCHGSYETDDTRYDAVQQTSVLGPIFAKNGYVFFGLFRRGVGLSLDQGVNSADRMTKANKEKGQEERNKVQIQQLQNDDLEDMISGLAFLRQRKDVDTSRLSVMGHSFGGSLALLTAEHVPGLKAIVVFGTAGYSWNLSPQLRQTLINAVQNINAPVLMVHAQNDYSVNPGHALDSVMTQAGKPHVLKIYPPFGSSSSEGHNFLFLSTKTWEADIFKFLRKNL